MPDARSLAAMWPLDTRVAHHRDEAAGLDVDATRQPVIMQQVDDVRLRVGNAALREARSEVYT